jgi:RHS repeat-associated protein
VAGFVPTPGADRVADLAFDAARRPVSGSLRLGAAAPLPLAFLHDGNGALTNLLAGGASVLSAAHDDLCRPAAAQGEAFLRDALGAVVATERGGARRLWIPDPDDPLRRPLAECDGTGAPVRTYLWSGARLLGFLDATNGLVVAHCDEQGSVVVLSDEGGTLVHAAAYGPFGEDWGSAGENPTPFAWLGSWGVRRIPGAGALGPLHLTAHRLYSPSLRRFLSPDPLGPAGGLNPYAYPGDPLESIDPLGLCAFRAPFEIVARGYDNITAEDWARFGEYWSDVGQVFAGYGDAAWGVANGVYQIIRHPYQTGENIGFAVGSALVDPLGTAQRQWDGFVSSFDDPRSFGQMFGGTLITAATVAAPYASSAGKVGQVGEAASKFGETGTRVFRVYGGKSSPMGKSWTPVDPRTVPNYRKAAGLPPENSGRFLIEGVLDSPEGVIKRGALPIGNNPGGLQEFVVPSPDVHIQILNVQGLNPQF